MRPSSNLPALIERYFTVRLMNERNVSANTIACYRDTFRQLFTFAQKELRMQPSALALDDLDAPFVSAFLADLETKRGVGPCRANPKAKTRWRAGSTNVTSDGWAPSNPVSAPQQNHSRHSQQRV
jgi:site-specific recombinase XerD